ncbi:hypothetical protein UlMin_036962 [Ulmus minor]
MSCWVWSRLLHHSSFGGIVNGSRSFTQFPTKPKPNSTCAHPSPLPSSSATPQLVALEYKDLNLSLKMSEEVGHVRIRQLVNPLSNSFSIPIQVPDWNKVFRDPILPLMVDIGSGSGRFLIWLAKTNLGVKTYLGLEIRHKVWKNSFGFFICLRVTRIFTRHFLFANVMNSFKQLVSTYPGPLMLVSILILILRKRYHKRRLVQKPLVDTIVESLMPGGQKRGKFSKGFSKVGKSGRKDFLAGSGSRLSEKRRKTFQKHRQTLRSLNPRKEC